MYQHGFFLALSLATINIFSWQGYITLAYPYQSQALRRLPTVMPIFGYLGNTSALMHMSYFFNMT